MPHSPLLKWTLAPLAAALCVTGPAVFAHTRLQTNTVVENTRLYNNVVIGHGCHNDATDANTTPVIGVSLVFPDGVDSIVSDATIPISNPDGTPNPAARQSIGLTVEDVFANWGNLVQAIQSGDVFNKNTVVEKLDGNGNVVGFSYYGGKLPGTIHGLVPFRTDAIQFNPDTCVKSATIEIWIADVCKVVKQNQLADTNVNMWSPAVGSDYDGVGLHGYNSPATLKVVRTSPLPAGCDASTAKEARITPSAAQLNRDAPIMKRNGQRFWPK
jgi:hypothetical protein